MEQSLNTTITPADISSTESTKNAEIFFVLRAFNIIESFLVLPFLGVSPFYFYEMFRSLSFTISDFKYFLYMGVLPVVLLVLPVLSVNLTLRKLKFCETETSPLKKIFSRILLSLFTIITIFIVWMMVGMVFQIVNEGFSDIIIVLFVAFPAAVMSSAFFSFLLISNNSIKKLIKK